MSTPGTHPDGASAAGAEPAGAEPAGAEAAPGAEALEPPSPGPRQLPVASVLLTSRPRVRPGGSRLTISDSPQAPERSATAVRLAALLATVTGLALAAYGLTLPHALLGVHDYDDGVYFGAALRLVDGVAPYRDFVLPHPPGIALLLAPIALLGRAIGSDDALAVARCLTVLVAGLNCGLVALALRHRGPIASLAGGLALACFPYAVTADQTVLLEPYLAFACLLGTVLAFPEGELATGRRAVLAGVVFGLAGCIKIWAAFPVIALLLVTAPRWRQSGTRLLAGVVAGFAVPCLPFAALAPGTFFHDIVVDQVLRGAGSAGYGIATRLGELSGISALASHLHPSGLVPIATVLAVLAGWSYLLLGRRARACDWFLLLAAVISLAAVLLAREFYEYYTYFPAVFVAGVVGVCAGRWGELLGALVGRLRTSSPLSPPEPPTPAGGTDSPRPASGGEGGGSAPRWPAYLCAALVLAAGATMVPFDVSQSHAYIEASNPAQPRALIDADIPPGACVVTDEAIVLITSDRFSATSPHCPLTVDTYGTWLSADPEHAPPSPGSDVPALARQWLGWFSEAQYVVETVPESDYIPWTPQLETYFASHFELVGSTTHAYVYKREQLTGPTGPPSSSPGRSGTTVTTPPSGPVPPGSSQPAAGPPPSPPTTIPLQTVPSTTIAPAAYEEALGTGLLALKSGHLEMARADFSAAAADDPTSPVADFDLGVADSMLHDSFAAYDAYEKALAIDSHYVPALYNIAVLLAPGEPLVAVTYYERAVATDPRDADARFNLGLLLVENGQTAAGDRQLEEAISTQPGLRARLPSSVHLPAQR